jgi:protein-arginine deiminase
VVRFFERQEWQQPLPVWTNWLAVGHVDEVISFVPGSREGSFYLLLASPAKALELLEDAAPDRALDAKYRSSFGLARVRDLSQARKAGVKWDFLGLTAKDYNRQVNDLIFGPEGTGKDPACLKHVLKEGLHLREEDIKEVPVLFANEKKLTPTWAALALTPGMVNLSSMGPYTMMARPFLSEFQSYVEDLLVKEIGQKPPLWINDWDLYHTKEGEVHCGSNMLRQPFGKDRKWWKHEPPASK